MAQIEGFHFGQLQEDPSSYNQVVISLRKYGVPFREIFESNHPVIVMLDSPTSCQKR
jgi:hypothetical protein